MKIAKNVNNLLPQRLVDSERQCWANAQYSKRECLKVVGIRCSVVNNSLEEKVIQVFEKVGCNIDYSNTEAFHRTSKKNGRVIVNFSRRSDCQRVLSIKKNLQILKLGDIVLTGDNKVFANHSLFSY